MPILALGKEAIRNTRPRPATSSYPQMSLDLAEQFGNLLRGESSAEDVASTLQQELTSIIGQVEEPHSGVDSIP